MLLLIPQRYLPHGRDRWPSRRRQGKGDPISPRVHVAQIQRHGMRGGAIRRRACVHPPNANRRVAWSQAKALDQQSITRPPCKTVELVPQLLARRPLLAEEVEKGAELEAGRNDAEDDCHPDVAARLPVIFLRHGTIFRTRNMCISLARGSRHVELRGRVLAYHSQVSSGATRMPRCALRTIATGPR